MHSLQEEPDLHTALSSLYKQDRDLFTHTDPALSVIPNPQGAVELKGHDVEIGPISAILRH